MSYAEELYSPSPNPETRKSRQSMLTPEERAVVLVVCHADKLVKIYRTQGLKFSGAVPDFRREEIAQIRCYLYLRWKAAEPPPNFRHMNCLYFKPCGTKE